MKDANEYIGIIGLGRLGLCLALNLEQCGFRVKGIDIDEERIKKIENKSLETMEPGVVQLLEKATNLEVGTELSRKNLFDCTIFFVVVPTNSLPEGGYDHSPIEQVIQQLEAVGPQDEEKILVLNCTTMPGYCDSIEERVKALGYQLVYNPEFIAQGSILHDQLNPAQVLIGARSITAGKQVAAIYEQLCANAPSYHFMMPLSAEISKLATNCFLTMKISFANAIGDLSNRVGGETEKILTAVGSDPRVGNAYLKHGYGYGGPCLPRDNQALLKFAKSEGLDLHLSEATERVNQEHLQQQFDEIVSNASKSEPIVFDHLGYKKGSEILESSQPLALAMKLVEAGFKVTVRESQPIIDKLQAQFGDLFSYEVERE